MKKSLLILLLPVFFVNHNIHADSHWLKSFYNAYMTNIMEGGDNAELCRLYMPEGLIMKLKRVSTATGADAVIRGQDVNEDALRTLSVIDLDNGWYMVEYRWDDGRPETKKRIPVKSIVEGDRYTIAYIVPEWNGDQYGDHLIYRENGCADIVDNTTGLEFVETFYMKYLSVYYGIPENIDVKLSALRSEYLTENALAQYDEAAADNAWDGYLGYDMLIDNCDFDYSWGRSVIIGKEADEIYKFTYNTGAATKSIALSIEKANGKFTISSIVKN